MIGMFLKFNQLELSFLTANVNLERRLSSPSLMVNANTFSTCFCVSADFYYGKYQSSKEVQHIMCSVFNDISHFQCFVTTQKLNFEFTSQKR